MRQVLGPGALGRPRGIGWRGRWEGGSGWGIHVNPWLIHVNVWQKPLQYCKVTSLQLIKINGGEKKEVLCSILSEKEYQTTRGYIPSGFKSINRPACMQLSQHGLDTGEGSLITEGASALVSQEGRHLTFIFNMDIFF